MNHPARFLPDPPLDPTYVRRLALDALEAAEQHCPYHGQDFERTGMWFNLPRCDSCKQPYRVALALEALHAAPVDLSGRA